MSSSFQALSDERFNLALTEVLYPRLCRLLESRGPGHCMRVADLDPDIMLVLCRAFRATIPQAQVFILEDNKHMTGTDKFYISSTKLVELRNSFPDGTLRPPLMVFIPPNLHTSAEDSFGVATFEEITLADGYKEFTSTLIEKLPASLRGSIQDIFGCLEGEKWPWSDGVGQARYLLTTIENEADGETLGASLYELGLVPDFRLFENPSTVYGKIRKNVECVRKLTYSDKSVRGRILDLEFNDKTVRRQLMQFLGPVGVEDPRGWTSQIVLDRNNWSISFDKWRFSEEICPDKILITVQHTDLPFIAEEETDEELLGLIGQQVLIPTERHKFNVVFEVNPHPGQVQGLHHFTVQILTKDGGPVGKAKKVKVWRAKRHSCTVSLDKLNKIDFEEGWYLVRILPWTENDDPIPLIAKDSELSGSELPKPNESEPFYVLPEGHLKEEPPQRSIPRGDSLDHARLKLQFTAIHDQRDPMSIRLENVGWSEKSGNSRRAANEMVMARFEHAGALHISVAKPLKVLEQHILSSPERPVSWKWHIDAAAMNSPPEEDIQEWPKSSAVDSFMAVRGRFFDSIRKGTKELVSQAADFFDLKEICSDYAAAYRDLLLDLKRKVERGFGSDQQRAIMALRTALAVDTIRIVHTDFRGRTREAALVGPTHPLRALWLATWAQLARQWMLAAKSGPEEYIAPVRDALLKELVPLNMPPVLVLSDGRAFTTVDSVHPFWCLYAPATEEDSRGLLGEICSAIGLPEPDIGGNGITGEVLASRIGRYLIQHPYIRTLSINAFNPGRSSVLANALHELQKEKAFETLHYDIRLFVPDPEAPFVGEALFQMLQLDETANSSNTDVFSTPTGSHLFPKLSVAIHSSPAFRENTDRFRTHLSILFDLFPAEEVGAGPAFHTMDIAPVHGLIQDYVTNFTDDEDGTFWRRQPRHGAAQDLPGCESMVSLLADLPQLVSGATATVATMAPAFEYRPILTLGLDVGQRELIYHIHEASDWVFTIDRNMGIEFYDHGGTKARPDYLIDYVPGNLTGGHQLLITSRSLFELECLLRPVLDQYGLKAEGSDAEMLLEQLRSLSGRLALKLISFSTQQAEALGLALARLYLDYQGALSNQIVVPLDAHLDLLQTSKREADELGDAITLKRTDLALFDLDAGARTILCNLVEVKCYCQVNGLGAYNQLKESITQQISQSERVLQRHFDPAWKSPDRPDRLLKTRELAILLQFYLDKSTRYGILDLDAADEARYLLATLEDGYSLQFRRSAIIFDFEKQGTDSPDHEVGIEFHRIGNDLIKALVEEKESHAADEVPSSLSTTEIPGLPRLDSAAFLVPKRERSVTWSTAMRKGAMRSSDLREEEDHAAVESIKLEEKEVERSAEIERLTGKVDILTLREISEVEDVSPVEVLEDEAGREENVKERLSVDYDVISGVTGGSPQYGILGEVAGRKVALDLNHTHTISLFGVQGGGKSYTLGSIVEMACMPIPNINLLPSPLAGVIFHYSPTHDYKPEFTSMVLPNSELEQLALLKERYGAEPASLKDIVILAPASKVEERRAEYPDIEVLPITFAASELKVMHWKFLMGAVGSQSMYIRQIALIMKKLRGRLTLDDLLKGVEESSLSDHLKDLARTRIQFAAEYIDDSRRLTGVIRPGRLLIVDLREELIEKDEALGLFVVLLQILSEATYEGQPFNKLVVFDEAHKYIENPDLIAGLIEVVREMRHKGTSIMVASQDPPSVPVSIIELSSQIILHKFNSPSWLKHIQKANSALNMLTPEKMGQLGPGEAYLWSSKANDEVFSTGAVKIRCRPRVTQHGGSTKTAVKVESA